MSDAKFLGLCIVFAAFLISGTIVWSTQANEKALTNLQFNGSPNVQISSIALPASIGIAGAVTVVPNSGTFPVSVSGSDSPAPINIKSVSDKQWKRE